MNELITHINQVISDSVKLKDRNLIPRVSGIYIVYDDETVYYVGQSVDLKQRHSQHHLQKRFEQLGEAFIGWKIVDPYHLNRAERICIERLNPLWNTQAGPEDSRPLSRLTSEDYLVDAVDRWYRAYHTGTSADAFEQAEKALALVWTLVTEGN